MPTSAALWARRRRKTVHNFSGPVEEDPLRGNQIGDASASRTNATTSAGASICG